MDVGGVGSDDDAVRSAGAAAVAIATDDGVETRVLPGPQEEETVRVHGSRRDVQDQVNL